MNFCIVCNCSSAHSAQCMNLRQTAIIRFNRKVMKKLLDAILHLNSICSYLLAKGGEYDVKKVYFFIQQNCFLLLLFFLFAIASFCVAKILFFIHKHTSRCTKHDKNIAHMHQKVYIRITTRIPLPNCVRNSG